MVALINRIGRLFGYDAIESQGRRRSVSNRVVREDHHTRGSKHRGLQANASDLCRNYSLASWMVRRHLDYVSQFAFHGRNDDEAVNRQIERLMREDGRPAGADVAGRFGREKLFRLAEARRVIDGDTLLVKLASGRLQGIQADLLRDPKKQQKDEEWINGVLVSGVGRPIAYGVHSRRGYTSDHWNRRVNAPNVIHYGFFDRYASDQVRGVSPLVSALNPMRDIYENFDYALAKSKVSQIFALAFYRNAEESALPTQADPGAGRGDDDDDGVDEPRGYRVDFGGGPSVLDLNDGDRAEFLESRQPSSEFQNFTQLVTQVAIKSLDIPYSFYDESHTNFFGSRAAWLHYERSCKDKRDDQIEMRRQYTVWKLKQWLLEGRLVLPLGMRLPDVAFEWVPRGMPWWDPAKEIRGQVQAIQAGLDTPQRICRSTGSDYFDNVDEIARARAYADEKGVPLEWSVTDPQVIIEAPSE